MDDFVDLIEASDLDGLIRHIDGLVANREWGRIEELRDRCLEAVQRGKQLWGVAQFAEYRLALDAPADLAGKVIKEGAGRFALGPLWEVAASSHPWEELAPHVADLRLRTLIGHERSIRGDRIDPAAIDPHVLEIPVAMMEWEPIYPVAVYRSDRADFPERDLPDLGWVDLPDRATRESDDDAVDALLKLVEPWVEKSNGRAEGIVVAGSALAAIRTLGPRRARVAPVSFEEALGAMVWTGASGGAYGRRRGTPVGRMLTWWAVAALLGFDEVEEPGVLGAEGNELLWWLWDPGDQVGGWRFHLAVEDPVDGCAWAVSAVDAV